MRDHVLPAMHDSQLNSCVRWEWPKRLNETSVCTDVFRVCCKFFSSLNIDDLDTGDERIAQRTMVCWHFVQGRPSRPERLQVCLTL